MSVAMMEDNRVEEPLVVEPQPEFELDFTGVDAIIFSSPQCVQCKATYRSLDNSQVTYKVIDVSENEAASLYVKSLGYLRAPVVITPGDQWTGFRPDKIKTLVEHLEVLKEG